MLSGRRMDLPYTQPLDSPRVTSVLRHGAMTTAACVLIAFVLRIAGGGQLTAHLTYSLSIGLIAWLFIDLGRVLFSHETAAWPHGRRDFWMVGLGIGCGFLGGNLVGDALTGTPTLGFLRLDSGKLAGQLVVTLAASIGICYFYYSRGRARLLLAHATIAQRDAIEAKLKLLESQLAPHMLFNTLANLRVLIASDPKRATKMLDQLERYLRATLASSRAISHPLEVEFGRLEDYLELMSVRMGPRLGYELDLPASLRDVHVPPLLLQPLVENAIRHGLEPVVAGGVIRVCARRELRTLVVDIADTGAGFDEAAPARGSGFGLAQVRARLSSLYGSRAALTLSTAAGGGTLARVRMPLGAADLEPQH